jgi:hypothetical protein
VNAYHRQLDLTLTVGSTASPARSGASPSVPRNEGRTFEGRIAAVVDGTK